MGDTIENIKVKICQSVEIPILNKCCFCIPLRKGLIAMAYINLVLTGIILPTYGYLIFSYDATQEPSYYQLSGGWNILPQLLIEFVALVIEFFMTIMFLVGLHMKKVKLMRVYLYFGIVYMTFSLLYNLVILIITKETANEFILVLSQLLIHFYFLILVWSSIVKMSRDGSVKYTRSEEEA